MKSLLFFLFLSPLFALSQTKSAPVNPNKTYHVCLDITLNDANALINGLSQSEVVAARLSTYFSQALSLQVNQQLAQEQEQQKKQDSLKPKPQGPNKPKSDIQDTNKPNTKDKGK